jgi:uncharacterized protein YaaQ
MKLIVTVVDDKDVHNVMAALTDRKIGVTCISSTGGFIVPGNSTLLIGAEEQDVPQVQAIIAELARVRDSYAPYAHVYAADMSLTSLIEVQVGGFLTFVLDIVHFEQV